MSIEEAVFRKMKLGETFCSYSFKPLRKTKGSLIVQLQRNHSYLYKKNHLTTTSTCENNELDVSRVKSLNKPNSSRRPISAKQNIKPTVATRPVSAFFVKKQTKIKKQVARIPSFHQNKMEEYLSDYRSLKSNFELKANKFQNIPKYLGNTFNKESPSRVVSRGLFSCKFDYEKYNDIQLLQNFDPKQHPEFFYNFSVNDNQFAAPFVAFHMVNIINKKHIMGSLTNKLFSEISIRQYQQKLNNFSTRTDENVFFFTLKKQKMEGQKQAYSEGFFWIGKPIKHSERVYVMQLIKKFILEFINNYNQVCQNFIPKIWIVDYQGKISYINREQIEGSYDSGGDEKYVSKSQLSNKKAGQICLSMFLSNLSQGALFRESNQSFFKD